MRSLCSAAICPAFVDATLRSGPFTTFPVEVLQRILVEVHSIAIATPLDTHYCSFRSPCIIAREAVQEYKDLQRVSKSWRRVITGFLRRQRTDVFRLLKGPAIFCSGNSSGDTLCGKYRPYQCIQFDSSEKAVLFAYDFSGPGGCETKSDVVIKVWSFLNEEYSVETATYDALTAVCDGLQPMYGIPRLLHRNKSPGYLKSVLTLEKLGPSLKDVQDKIPFFDERATLAVAIQLLDRYKDMHSRGVIHNGAKPANFCIPPKPSTSSLGNTSTIYAIDFGFSSLTCRNYILSTHSTVPGNHYFISALSQFDLTQSQRDDLESLGYLLVQLHKGSLPWTGGSAFDSWRLKMSIPTTELFRNMDIAFVTFFHEVRQLAFRETPPYESMRNRFSELWRTRGYGGVPGEIDWWALFEGRTPEDPVVSSPSAALVELPAESADANGVDVVVSSQSSSEELSQPEVASMEVDPSPESSPAADVSSIKRLECSKEIYVELTVPPLNHVAATLISVS